MISIFIVQYENDIWLLVGKEWKCLIIKNFKIGGLFLIFIQYEGNVILVWKNIESVRVEFERLWFIEKCDKEFVDLSLKERVFMVVYCLEYKDDKF